MESQPVEVPSVTVTPTEHESAPSVIPTVVSPPVNTSPNSNVHLELPNATPTVVSIPTVPKVNTTATPIPTISVGNNISAGNVSSPGDSQSSVDFSSLGSLE